MSYPRLSNSVFNFWTTEVQKNTDGRYLGRFSWQPRATGLAKFLAAFAPAARVAGSRGLASQVIALLKCSSKADEDAALILTG